MLTLSTALKFSSKFFRKRSFFDQNQQPLNNVEPFERILRALFKAREPPVLGSPPNLIVRNSPHGGFLRWGDPKSRTWRKRNPPSNPQNRSILGVVLQGGDSSSRFLVWKPPNRLISVLTIKYPLSGFNKNSIHDLMIIKRKIIFQ